MSHSNDFVWQALEEMGEKEADSKVREIESSFDFKTRDKDEEGMQFHRNFQGKHSYIFSIKCNLSRIHSNDLFFHFLFQKIHHLS